MVKLMVFNRSEEYIGDVKAIIEAKQLLELNGEDSITIDVLDDNIEKGYRILYHDREANQFFEYIVQEKDEYKEGNLIIHNIYAENSLSETVGDYIEDKRSVDQNTSHAVDRALENTRWEIGEVYNSRKSIITFYRTNARAAISEIIDEWQLELKTEITWDSINKKIYRKLHFLNKRGEFRGNRLTYTRDIIDIRRKTLPRDVITALYGYGKGQEKESGGYGRRVDFSEINNGKAYIESNSAKELWGRIGKNGERIHTFGKLEFDNITDKQFLLSRTKEELEKLSKPAVSYEAKILDFFRLSESEHDYIELGDTVKILDRDFVPAINYNTRVLKIERDLINKENTVINLGEIVKNIADRESIQDKKLDELNKENNTDGSDWGDDGEDDWTPGVLPEYERAKDLVRAVPSLGIGLSSWIDINEVDAVLADGARGVSQVFDAINNKLVYSQNVSSRRPTLVEKGYRRWLSFNPDPRTLLRWRHDENRPIDAIQQHGQYLDNINKGEKVKTIYIAYYDRTPNIIEEEFNSGGFAGESRDARRRKNASNAFPVGYSSPLGHPYSYSIFTSGGVSPDIGYDGVITPFQDSPHIREEAVIGKVSKVEGLSFKSLGMNKESYDGWRYHREVSVQAYSNSWGIYNYEMNAFFTGEIGEVIVYNRELDSNEHEVITQYLEDKYGTYSILT